MPNLVVRIGVEGVKQLVCLGDNVGAVVEPVILVEGAAVIAAGAVGEGAFFAHLLKDDGVHRAAKVFVEEVHLRCESGVVLGAAEVFGEVDILGVIVHEEHHVLVGGLRIVYYFGRSVLGGLHGVNLVDGSG